MAETIPEHYANLPEHYGGYKSFVEEFDLKHTDSRAFY